MAVDSISLTAVSDPAMRVCLEGCKFSFTLSLTISQARVQSSEFVSLGGPSGPSYSRDQYPWQNQATLTSTKSRTSTSDPVSAACVPPDPAVPGSTFPSSDLSSDLEQIKTFARAQSESMHMSRSRRGNLNSSARPSPMRHCRSDCDTGPPFIHARPKARAHGPERGSDLKKVTKLTSLSAAGCCCCCWW